MKMKSLAFAALSALVFAAAPPVASVSAQDRGHDDGYYGGMDLHLICYGTGDKPNVQTVPTFHWNRRHHELETDYATIMSRREFDSMVQIDIHGDEGHIWLPKKRSRPSIRVGRMAGGNWMIYRSAIPKLTRNTGSTA